MGALGGLGQHGNVNLPSDIFLAAETAAEPVAEPEPVAEEASVTEAAVANAEGEGQDDADKPKRRGWWSLGR